MDRTQHCSVTVNKTFSKSSSLQNDIFKLFVSISCINKTPSNSFASCSVALKSTFKEPDLFCVRINHQCFQSMVLCELQLSAHQLSAFPMHFSLQSLQH